MTKIRVVLKLETFNNMPYCIFTDLLSLDICRSMSSYHHLSRFINAYLNQDYHLIAETIEGVVDYYVDNNSVDDVLGLQNDIGLYRKDHAGALDAAFKRSYGFDVDPQLWDLTTESFFQLVCSHLAASQNKR